MQIALQLVAQGEADACVSAGNTGALMLMAKHTLNTLPGISRPALVASLPNNRSGHTYLLDLGANLQCDSDTLFNFAVMGSVLCEKVEQIKKPVVALLNVGKESNKGHDVLKRCAHQLRLTKHINYCGFVEANELLSGSADVIVTDGFSGNIALKSYEGMGREFLAQLNKAINVNFYSRLLGKLLNPILKKQLKHLHPDMYNGASLIGLRGIVVKSHGSANEVAFAYAIEQAIKEIQWQIPASVSNKLETVLLERDCLSHE
jgi:glycerol-3-phosphate acyltransferase PlsX